jgi:hypothetical protein
MRKTTRDGGGKLPYNAERPEYTDRTVSLDTRFNERLTNYLKHYEDETGHRPDLGILLMNIVSPALDTDAKFVQKERTGHFNANGNGHAAASATARAGQRETAGAGAPSSK